MPGLPPKRDKQGASKEEKRRGGDGVEVDVGLAGLLRGVCQACHQIFYVEARLGALVCPHCTCPKIRWRWGKLCAAFVPEQGGEIEDTEA